MAEVEPEWSDVDLACIDGYLNWTADLHVCGHHLSDSRWDPNNPHPKTYTAVYDRCMACEAAERVQALQAKTDKDKTGIYPHGRLWRVIET